MDRRPNISGIELGQDCEEIGVPAQRCMRKELDVGERLEARLVAEQVMRDGPCSYPVARAQERRKSLQRIIRVVFRPFTFQRVEAADDVSLSLLRRHPRSELAKCVSAVRCPEFVEFLPYRPPVGVAAQLALQDAPGLVAERSDGELAIDARREVCEADIVLGDVDALQDVNPFRIGKGGKDGDQTCQPNGRGVGLVDKCSR